MAAVRRREVSDPSILQSLPSQWQPYIGQRGLAVAGVLARHHAKRVCN